MMMMMRMILMMIMWMFFGHLSPPFLDPATATGPRYSPFASRYFCTKIFLYQHIFAPTCFCIKIFCTKIHFRFKIQIHTHDNDVIHLVLLVNLNFPAFLRFSKKKYTWELSSYLVQPGAHISKYIGQPFKLSFTHVQCPLDVWLSNTWPQWLGIWESRCNDRWSRCPSQEWTRVRNPFVPSPLKGSRS